MGQPEADRPAPIELGSPLRRVIDAERAFAAADLYAVGSMLSYDERLILHWAARTGPSGAILDLGAFLGGSSLSLARGSLARTDPLPVHSYDLFQLDGDWERHWLPEGFSFEIGDSTLPAYEHNIAGVRDHVIVHPGDVNQAEWDGPISVLFVDIAKTWRTADSVARTFMPALIPGESVVIQQDLAHWAHPWCAITMELLADRFEYLGWVWYSSVLYRSTAAIKREDLPASLFDAVSLDEALRLLDRTAARLGDPIGATTYLSGVRVLGDHGLYDAGRKRIREVQGEYATQIPHLDEGCAVLSAWLDEAEAGRTWAQDKIGPALLSIKPS